VSRLLLQFGLRALPPHEFVGLCVVLSHFTLPTSSTAALPGRKVSDRRKPQRSWNY
jgi:hypothetical protein